MKTAPPGYKVSYNSLLNNEGMFRLSPLYYYDPTNPFYNDANAWLPRSQSNTTYPTEIYAHIGNWIFEPITSTYGSRAFGPCMS